MFDLRRIVERFARWRPRSPVRGGSLSGPHDDRVTIMLVPSAAEGKPIQFQANKRMLLAVMGVGAASILIVAIGLVVAVVSVLSSFGKHDLDRRSVVEEQTEMAALRRENQQLKKALRLQIERTQDRIAEVNRLISRISAFTGLPLDLPSTTTVTTDSAALDVGRKFGRGGPLSLSAASIIADYLGHGPRSYAKALESQLFELDSLIVRLERAGQHFEEQQRLLATTPLICPVKGDYVFTDRFGERIHPLYHRKDFHKGLDIAAPYRTPIIAPADGKVVFAGYDKSRGLTLTIDHGVGLYARDGMPTKRHFVTRYFHCSKILVRKGVRVRRGDVIALVGSTGTSTGNHVHYEVLVDGEPVDPEMFILDAR